MPGDYVTECSVSSTTNSHHCDELISQHLNWNSCSDYTLELRRLSLVFAYVMSLYSAIKSFVYNNTSPFLVSLLSFQIFFYLSLALCDGFIRALKMAIIRNSLRNSKML